MICSHSFFSFLLIFCFIFSFSFVYSVSASTSSSLVIDDGFIVLRNQFDGATTDFLFLNDSELSSIQNLTLENSSFVKVVFEGPINLTDDAQGNVIDFDSAVSFSFNSVVINRSLLTSLIGNVTISLYNLGFDEGFVLQDGVVCSSCTVINDSSELFVFKVSNFTYNYTIEAPEDPTPGPGGSGGGGDGGSGGGGGGGGGGGSIGGGSSGGSSGGSRKPASVQSNLEDSNSHVIFVNPRYLVVEFDIGTQISESLEVTHLGRTSTLLSLDVEEINDYITLNDTFFPLSAESKRELNFFFEASSVNDVGVHYGLLDLYDPNTKLTRDVPIILAISSNGPLFDFSLDLESTYYQDNPISFYLNVENLSIGDFDGTVSYKITDPYGVVFEERREFVTFSAPLALKRTFDSSSIVSGNYVLVAEFTHNGITEVSAVPLVVLSGKDSNIESPLRGFFTRELLYSVLATISLLFIIILVSRRLYNNYLLSSSIHTVRSTFSKKKD